MDFLRGALAIVNLKTRTWDNPRAVFVTAELTPSDGMITVPLLFDAVIRMSDSEKDLNLTRDPYHALNIPTESKDKVTVLGLILDNAAKKKQMKKQFPITPIVYQPYISPGFVPNWAYNKRVQNRVLHLSGRTEIGMTREELLKIDSISYESGGNTLYCFFSEWILARMTPDRSGVYHIPIPATSSIDQVLYFDVRDPIDNDSVKIHYNVLDASTQTEGKAVQFKVFCSKLNHKADDFLTLKVWPRMSSVTRLNVIVKNDKGEPDDSVIDGPIQLFAGTEVNRAYVGNVSMEQNKIHRVPEDLPSYIFSPLDLDNLYSNESVTIPPPANYSTVAPSGGFTEFFLEYHTVKPGSITVYVEGVELYNVSKEWTIQVYSY